MKRLNRLGIAVGAAALALVIAGVIALAPAPSADAGPNHVTVCHQTGAGLIALDVNANAEEAHMGHGDHPYFWPVRLSGRW